VKKVFLILLAIAVIGALIFGGCAKPVATKVLKIGSVLNLADPWGIEENKWFTLFAKLINAEGGWEIGGEWYTVEMIVYDSAGDAIKARDYLEKLVLEDGVKFILGTPTGNPATDCEVTEPNKVICLGLDVIGTSTDPAIQYYWTPNGMFFGRGLMWGMYTAMQAQGKRSYVSVKTDNEMGHATDGMCNSTWAVAAPQVEYLGTVFFDPATTDFGPVATKIMSYNPDVIDLNYTAVGAPVFNALYDLGCEATILPAQMPPDVFQAILTHCGPEFMEGWQYFLQDPRLYPDQPDEILDLFDAYIEEYGTFQTGGCMWVAPWFVLKDAIDNTDSVDVETIKAYLDNQPHPVRTLTGYCQLFARPEAGNLRTISGEPADFIGGVVDGKEVPLAYVSVKDHYLASIMSYGLVDVYKAYWEEYGYPTFPDQPSFIKFSDLGIEGQD